MSFPLGLSSADKAALDATLADTHEVHIEANLLNMAGRVVGAVDVTGGQVLGDRRRFGVPHGPTKRITLTAVDPHNALGIDTDDPGDGILYRDRQVEVIYGVRVSALGRWVEWPIFLGSPTDWQRNGDEVTMAGDDASALGMGAAWSPLTIPKGTRKVDAIERILRQRTGMTRFLLPNVNARLHKPVSLHRETRPFAVADRIADSMDMQLFRRADGTAVLRHWPHAVAHTFTQDETVEEFATDDDETKFANTVEVLGRNPKGPKPRVRGEAQAPYLSAQGAKRIGEQRPDGTIAPRRIVTRIENDHIRSDKEADRKAERILREHLRGVAKVTGGVLPWAYLEVGDWLRADTDEGPVEFRLDNYALPLGGDDPMALGYQLSAPVSRRRIRR